MPIHGEGGRPSSTLPGAYTSDPVQVLGGDGSPSNPFVGFFYVGVGNFNAATTGVPIPIAGTGWLTMNFKRLKVRYVGANPGVTLEPTVFLFEAGASVEFPLGVRQVTLAATDSLVWDLGNTRLRFNNEVSNGNMNGANGYPYINFNAAGYAATDDFYVFLEMEWTTRGDE